MSGDPVLDALTAALDSPERAAEILQTARSTIPGATKDPRLLLSLSRAYEAAGRLKDAVEPVQALLGAHPNLAAGWARLGGVFLAGGLFAQAEQALDRAIELDPDERVGGLLEARARPRPRQRRQQLQIRARVVVGPALGMVQRLTQHTGERRGVI